MTDASSLGRAAEAWAGAQQLHEAKNRLIVGAGRMWMWWCCWNLQISWA